MTTTSAPTELIGRGGEWAAVEAFLDALATGPTALVLSGEAGIGKSTVWRAGVSSARLRSFRVLLCRPAEAEAGLSFVALADLLENVPEDVLASLPAPQREALCVALRRTDTTGELDRVALARGALAAISGFASERPTVVAIDDAQWLDAPSRDALRFVFRRLVGGESVGLLATVRGDDAAAPLEIDAALPSSRVTRLLLGPLARGELESVVRAHADLSLPRPTWSAIHRVSGGNPFFAIQIADAVARKGGLAPGEEPPLPDSVTAAVRDRLASLSTRARRTLLHASALRKPTAALLHAAAVDAGLQEGLEARVLELEGDRLRFTHPLLAAEVYREASAAKRRGAHRLLAEVVDDPEEQAVHLGRGNDAPDETAAATLEAAADRAARRGVPETAAELAQHAVRLTPASDVEDAARRTILVARYAGRAGDIGRSVEVLRRLVATLPPGRPRAGAFGLLGFIAWDSGTLMRAIDEAAGDAKLLAVAHTDISMIELRRGNRAAAVVHARAAVSAAKGSGDPATLAKALTAQALPEAHGPAERALALLADAAELERTLTQPLSLTNSPTTWRGAVLLDADRFDEAREALEEAYQRGLALGHASRAVPLTYLAELECREGNYNRPLAHSVEAATLWAGGPGEPLTLVGRVLIEAHLGNAEGARADGLRSIARLREEHEVVTLARIEGALGLLELSLGNFAAALDRLDALVKLPDDEPLRDGPAFRANADAVEALLGLGRMDEAGELAEGLERRARSADLPSRIAASARCRALVLAEQGDVAGARAAIGDATAVHARHHEPFEQARTLLVAGSIERRAKRKADAHAAFKRARTIFEELGARLWSERARLELERTGLQRTADGELSAAERRVADLAAGGATNKEIAAQLFMSVKTVEAHLSHVYRKLGVHSRTELAANAAKLR